MGWLRKTANVKLFFDLLLTIPLANLFKTNILFPYLRLDLLTVFVLPERQRRESSQKNKMKGI